jgi:hypothetical protein
MKLKSGLQVSLIGTLNILQVSGYALAPRPFALHHGHQVPRVARFAPQIAPAEPIKSVFGETVDHQETINPRTTDRMSSQFIVPLVNNHLTVQNKALALFADDDGT